MDPIRSYHERSKHHLHRYAPGPGNLDWDMQPDPFRRFDGAPQLDLPLLKDELPVRWDDLFAPGGRPSQAMTVENLAQLMQLSLGLSAWKSYGGNRWALRCNPSSGNLHPTEGYLVCPDLPGLSAGVYHYRPDRHGLEQRAAAPLTFSGGVLVALTGIHWREAWKYGMRAFRYCQHDCGHALAALAYAAAIFGWPTRLMTEWSDDDITPSPASTEPRIFPSPRRKRRKHSCGSAPARHPIRQACARCSPTPTGRGMPTRSARHNATGPTSRWWRRPPARRHAWPPR